MRGVFLLGLVACSEAENAGGLPAELPYSITRPDRGAPLEAAEIDALTARLTAFYARTDWFRWISSVSHGNHASTGKPDYAVWWHDVEAVKAGDVVTFRHSDTGGAHNIFIPTPKILQQAAAGYLLSGDSSMGEVVEQYSKGIVASMKGMVFDAQDPNPYLMARNIVTQSHSYALDDGRMKAVDYSPWFNAYVAWNAQRIHYPSNPSWGDIWVTNMRSKDDVPHIFTVAPYLRYVVERGKDARVRDAAREAVEHLSGFSRDIVDSGYQIRTKDANGQPWIPTEDLASFVTYESIVPNGECAAKLTAALLGYGEPRGNDCARNEGNDYEAIAVGTHYYNYAIVRNFHLSAILSALVEGDPAAERLLRGLAMRIDRYVDPASDEPGKSDARWESDIAVYLLQSAAVGLPLTSEEARLIHTHYAASLDAYEAFERWNLWDVSVPDGTYSPNDGYKPKDAGVAVEEMAFFLTYCFSPFKNPTSAPVIDCDQITAW